MSAKSKIVEQKLPTGGLIVKKGFLTLAAAVLAASAMAQFTPGRLVVAVVGDGTAALNNASTVAKLQ